jgi:hypothetical protein
MSASQKARPKENAHSATEPTRDMEWGPEEKVFSAPPERRAGLGRARVGVRARVDVRARLYMCATYSRALFKNNSKK